ncbi:MAG: peptide chain release factor N(5)-glutamine methyltransferase [Planctomycetota bacterium]
MSVLRGAEGWLEKRGVESPKRSAELLLGHVLGLDRLQLYLEHDRPLVEEERGSMRALLVRRGDGEPVAHLLGSWQFRSLELEVGPAVLIPRPETEELVDVVHECLGDAAAEPLLGADLGCGSGAIAIALASECPGLRMVAIDQSKNALHVARTNVSANDLADRVDLVHSDWWQSVAAEPHFDFVVSNPPYIDPGKPDGLAEDVQRFEPPLALYSAKGDPASCYREIAAGLEAHLKPGGWFVAETGLGASDAALAVLQGCSFLQDAELRDDLGGHPRFVLARRA